MLQWYCDKSTYSTKPICLRKKSSEAKASGDKSLLTPTTSKLTMADSIAAVKAFCADPTNKGSSICAMQKSGRAGGLAATANAQLKTSAAGGAKLAMGSKKPAGTKKAAKAAKAASAAAAASSG